MSTTKTRALITYEVDDVQHWLASPTRTAAFEAAGFTVKTFVDPMVDGRAALLVEEVPRGRIIAPYRPVDRGLDKLQQLISSPEAALRMERDGVRSATMSTYVEG
jgi:hypothetical protein